MFFFLLSQKLKWDVSGSTYGARRTHDAPFTSLGCSHASVSRRLHVPLSWPSSRPSSLTVPHGADCHLQCALHQRAHRHRLSVCCRRSRVSVSKSVCTSPVWRSPPSSLRGYFHFIFEVNGHDCNHADFCHHSVFFSRRAPKNYFNTIFPW